MFQNLSERLSQTLKSIKGQARLTDDNIKDTLREVRRALLEADVALPVIKEFIERVRERAVGQEVSKSLSPGQQFVKIVQQELEAIMGEANDGFVLKGSP
ncbi:signal recognition particle receptor subunit alpha, partial [Halomonas sp. A3H3]